jgi:hypothetical protein
MPSKTNTSISQQSTTEEKRPLRQERGISHPVPLATAQPRPTTPRQILQLQKTIGNRAVTRMMPTMIQRTLDVDGADVDPADLKEKIAARKNLSTWSQELQTAVDTLNEAPTSATSAEELADAIVVEAKVGGRPAKTTLKQIIEAYLKARQRREKTARRLQQNAPKILGRCSTERHIFPGATNSAIKEGRTTIVKEEKYNADLDEINNALDGLENGLADDNVRDTYAIIFVQTGYELNIDGTDYRWQPDHGMYPIGGTDTKSDAAAETAIKTNTWA